MEQSNLLAASTQVLASLVEGAATAYASTDGYLMTEFGDRQRRTAEPERR